jgi:two-component system NtrC family sensor kinase
MESEQLNRIFERFYRSPDSPGSGLGLPIARDLVEAHGGTLTATSAPGQGTTVRFTLPR